MTTAAPETIAFVVAAAKLLDLRLEAADVPAVATHYGFLMDFARVIDEPDPEPAPVFRPARPGV